MAKVKISHLASELGASEDLIRRSCAALGIDTWGLDYVMEAGAERIRVAFAKLLVKPEANKEGSMEFDIKIQVYTSRDGAEENLGDVEGSMVLRHPNKENELWMCARPLDRNMGRRDSDGITYAQFLYTDGEWRESPNHCAVFEDGEVKGYFTLQYGMGTDYVVGSPEG